jgi:hypothetical protein
MRAMVLVVSGLLAVCSTVPAFAAKKHTTSKAPTSVESFEKCEQLAIDRGVPHGQTGHSEFVSQCMGGKVRGRSAPE